MNDLVVKDSTSLPAHLSTDKAVGNENIGAETLAVPYISLLQALSKPCTKGSAEYVKGAQAGMFYNTVTKAVADELLVANMFMDSVFVANKKQNLGDDYQGEHPTMEAAVEHLESEGLNVNDYDVQEVHKHMLALFDEKTGAIESGAIYSFRKTALRTSRTWNSQILSQYPNADRFAGIWKLSALTNSNNLGTWFTPNVEFVGFANEDIYADLQAKYKLWKSQ